MNTTHELARMELSSDCSCTILDENEAETPSDECFGCWNDDLEYFNWAFLIPFLDAHGLVFTSPLRIDAEQMGWDRRSGYTLTDGTNLIWMLTLHGDFTLRVTLSEDKRELTIVRSSHDELGARFVITPAKESEED